MAMCFLDRTFCGSPGCKGKCGRQWTPELEARAAEWWKSPKNPTGEGAPVAFSDFCDEQGNYKGG